MLSVYPNRLVYWQGQERLVVSAISNFAIRVQASLNSLPLTFSWELKNISSECQTKFVDIYGYLNVNGLTAKISHHGQLSFLKGEEAVLAERYRDFGCDQPHSPALKRKAREWTAHPNGAYSLCQSLEGTPMQNFTGWGNIRCLT